MDMVVIAFVVLLISVFSMLIGYFMGLRVGRADLKDTWRWVK